MSQTTAPRHHRRLRLAGRDDGTAGPVLFFDVVTAPPTPLTKHVVD